MHFNSTGYYQALYKHYLVSLPKTMQLPSPCVTIPSTTCDLLYWIQNKTNCGTITKKKNYNHEKHHNSYTLTFRYNQAINLLKEIEPYLIIQSKRLRASLIINKYKALTPRNGRYSPQALTAKKNLYLEFIHIK
jgi:hypothetical protein